MNIKQVLKLIRKRPSMYIGNESIYTLEGFLNGICIANKNTEDIEFVRDFQCWIENKYNINSSQSWAKIIDFYSVNEREALKNFFEVYDEYINGL